MRGTRKLGMLASSWDLPRSPQNASSSGWTSLSHKVGWGSPHQRVDTAKSTIPKPEIRTGSQANGTQSLCSLMSAPFCFSGSSPSNRHISPWLVSKSSTRPGFLLASLLNPPPNTAPCPKNPPASGARYPGVPICVEAKEATWPRGSHLQLSMAVLGEEKNT